MTVLHCSSLPRAGKTRIARQIAVEQQFTAILGNAPENAVSLGNHAADDFLGQADTGDDDERLRIAA